MSAENILTFVHVLCVLWYMAGLAAMQVTLARVLRNSDVGVRVESLEEASHYQGILLVPGAIAAGASGVFLWTLDHNLLTTGWLLGLGALYVITLLVFLPVIGLGLRRARLAALQAQKSGRSTPDLEEAMSDSVPLVASGIATLLLVPMAALSVFQP